MEFEWDEAKERSNQTKHGVAFILARNFLWDSAIVQLDDRKDYGEERFIARGFGRDGIGYHIVFTLRGDRVRVISIRRFSSRDYERYGT